MFENIPLAELAIGRSTVRQRILALLMAEPGRRLHLREIQRRVGTSPGTASRELGRLLAAGLIEREAEGVQVYFQAADNPVAAMMRQLLLMQSDAPVLPKPSSIARPRRPKPAAMSSLAPVPAPEPDTTQVPWPDTTPAPEPGLAAAQTRTSAATTAQQPRLLNVLPREPRDAIGPVPSAVPSPVPPLAPEAAVPEPAGVAPAVPAPDPLGLLVGARFAAALRPLYAGRLKGVYLFGSRALGPARDDADVELLIVLDEVAGYGEELERTSAVCAQLTLELGLVVSRVFADASHWPGHVDGFVPVIADEGER